MLEVSDKNLKKLGELENAIVGPIERRANQLWSASFTLPKNDPKNELCKHFNYIDIYGPSGRYYGKYRILNIQTALDTVTYECEHVLGILNNYTMPGYHRFENFTTRDVLEQLLDMQTFKHIRLGKVEFSRRFRYDFENHNGLLSAIFEVPQRFNEPYLFTFDTETYPWTLNLIKPDNEVKWDLRWGRDLGNFEEYSDPTGIVNRIFPYGYGEGVNTLDITSVNNGVPYIEDKQSIDEYGLIARTWMDKRFEDAESLLEEAKAKLSQWKDPRISFTVGAVDLSIKEEYKHLTKPLYAVGKIHVDDKVHEARIVGEIIPDLSREYDVDYEVNNKLNELADAQIDLERRQYITEAYAQGSTTLLPFSYQDNADDKVPALIPFYIDDDVIHVNTCELTFRTKPFRAYSRATAGGGAVVTSTASGGGRNVTSGSGGGKQTTTQSGGGVSETSGAGGNHTHVMFNVVGYQSTSTPESLAIAGAHTSSGNQTFYLPESAAGEYRTRGASGNHTHSVSIPNHVHEITLPNHTHSVEIPNHTHEITLPNHTHDILHGIYELHELPKNVQIRVDGNLINFSDIKGDRINLVDYMAKDDDGKIKRGRHEVTILPNGLARIEADIILRVFIQSRLGEVY